MVFRGLLRKSHGNVENANGARVGDGATGIVLASTRKNINILLLIVCTYHVPVLYHTTAVR